MAVHHIISDIRGLLRNNTPKQLDRLFGMKNGEAHSELLDLLSQGHKYIGSSNCKHFDPMEGCMCSKFKEEEIKQLN